MAASFLPRWPHPTVLVGRFLSATLAAPIPKSLLEPSKTLSDGAEAQAEKTEREGKSTRDTPFRSETRSENLDATRRQ
jgi:hypothetical protein